MAVQVYHGPAGMSLGRMLAILEATEAVAPLAQAAAPKAVEIPVMSAVAAPKVERASSPMVASQATAAASIVEVKGRGLAERIAGLKGLEIECPYAAGVELALGTDGRLHLLAGAGESGPSLGVSDAAQRLLTAAAWAGDHAKLLRAACPAFGGGDPVLHVVVREAREARGLLDTGMRVHLLSRVEVGGVAGWVVVDLN